MISQTQRRRSARNELIYQGRRIRKPGGFDDDTAEGDLASLRKNVEFVQRRSNVTADRTTEASCRGAGDLRVADAHEIVVECDIAEFVDDDGRIREGRIGEKPVEKS